MLTDEELYKAFCDGAEFGRLDSHYVCGLRAVERAVLMAAADEIEEVFRVMTFNQTHLGFGQIRLSLDAQKKIVAMIRGQAGGEDE